MGGPQFGAPIMLGIYGDTEESVTYAAKEIENHMRSEVCLLYTSDAADDP